MKKKIKFKIGEFSKLCQVSVKTLRFYEEKELLIPSEVDEFSGYRFYTVDQLRKMNQIHYFKMLGFSLEEIAHIFDDEDGMPSLDEIAEKKEQSLAQIENMKWRLAQLDNLNGILHKTENIMQKVFEKTLPAQIFATHRRKIDSYKELFTLCPCVIGPEMQRIGCECAKPEYCFTVEHNEEYGVDIDIEYFEAVTERKPDSDIITFKELPEVPSALCINHFGAYELMPQTLTELYAYAEAHGYSTIGLPRFCYIDGIWNKDSVDEWRTEIQIPITK